MKTSPVSRLFAAACLALAALSAHAAEPAATGAPDCITLSPDQQVVRARAERDILLRNADQHFIVRFKDNCSSVAQTRTFSFDTPQHEGQLCGGGISTLTTKSQKCEVAALEPITPEQFATRARARSR
ncbi:hypothetical protein [Stenotrophomonas sp.]|uniref:hypothetical protein n=1 Tax=Stenotrophomonas sp. TaxID=69392 RepID=UPI002FC6136A